jgi:pyruvate-formate lyase-activating enzyme
MEAYQPRHWVRCVTACNNRCLFCLDADTPREQILSVEDLRRDIDRGIDERGATRLVLSGGEPTLHPSFVDLVRYGVSRGYERVQCISNGHRFAHRPFLSACLDAGLGEITFSLHGHTAALHDALTRTPGSFARLVRGIDRAMKDGRPVVNIDVCLNQQNIAHLEQIVELGIALGVTEFDLLHVIPQSAAFENRSRLFYDVREHLPTLQRVLRLNRHPRFHVWTNRLPATHLEGFEEHIQSPRKLADELSGRSRQVRAYLDEGTPLACRDPQRCPHCFLEPFCTTMDRVLHRLHSGGWQVWWSGDEPIHTALFSPPLLPFAFASAYGCTRLGRRVSSLSDALAMKLPPGAGHYLEVARDAPAPLPSVGLLASSPGPSVTLVARSPAQLEAWLDRTQSRLTLEVVLNRRTATWLVEHRRLLADHAQFVCLAWPGFAQLADARTHQVQHPAALLEALNLPIRCSGLPACLAPGAQLVPPTRVLPQALFDPGDGHIIAEELLRHHVQYGYRVKSARCADCAVNTRCAGAHINTIRHLGLAILKPLSRDAAATGVGWPAEGLRQLTARWPEPPVTVGGGRAPEPRYSPPRPKPPSQV